MLKISNKAQEYLDGNKEVQEFNSTLVYDEEGYREGIKMSLTQCLESILGTKDGELKIDEEGNVILNDGESEFVLASFSCGFDNDCCANVVIFNRQENYELKFQFPYDDIHIERCYINDEEVAVNFDRKKGNEELLEEVNKRTNGELVQQTTGKKDWKRKVLGYVKTMVQQVVEKIMGRKKLCLDAETSQQDPNSDKWRETLRVDEQVDSKKEESANDNPKTKQEQGDVRE